MQKIHQGDENLFTNAELKRMIEQTMTRFENWRVEVERNPNPRMIHTLKNIITIIDNVASVNQAKLDCSYKKLTLKMAALLNETAQLNMAIAEALEHDDLVDAEEQQKISKALFSLVNSAFLLIKTVQDGFGAKDIISMDVPALPFHEEKTEKIK